MASAATARITPRPAPHDDTNELIHRCRAGDVEAFNPLFGRYYGATFGLAYRILGSRESAEDATQDAFLRALTRLDSFRGKASFRTWLHRITVTTCLDHLRRRKTHASIDEVAEVAAPRAASTQLRLELQEVLACMDPREAEALLLCEIQGLSYVEIAERVGDSVQAVRSRLHRARVHFRALYLSPDPISAGGDP